MSNNSNILGAGCATMTMFSLGYSLVVAVVSIWTDRNLDFWVSQIKGEEVDIPYWMSFITTFICNGFILVANILAELGRFAV